MRRVIKLGGSLLTDESKQSAVVNSIAALHRAGDETIVVHGGGKHLSAALERLGIASRFERGLRVTDSATLECVLMVLAGLVNKKLVSAFYRAGCNAVGISGGDGQTFRAEKMNDDLGFVGQIVRGDPRLIETLLVNGYLPIVACLAVDGHAQYYNVNADQMAAACAASCDAAQLVYLTDVDGVLDAKQQVIPRLSPRQINELMNSGVVAGGMLPKLSACRDALNAGVREIRILNGGHRLNLLAALTEHRTTGTAIEHDA